MASRTITGTIKVQLMSCYGPADLERSDAEVFERISLIDIDMSDSGYAVVGTASVTITLNDADTIIGDKVEALRSQSMKVQADATNEVTRIERQIQQLLAITNSAEAA